MRYWILYSKKLKQEKLVFGDEVEFNLDSNYHKGALA
jgi:hypothetical protein